MRKLKIIQIRCQSDHKASNVNRHQRIMNTRYESERWSKYLVNTKRIAIGNTKWNENMAILISSLRTDDTTTVGRMQMIK